MNNPFILSSSPLALYQKAVALKKEKKKWHDTRVYVGRHLMRGPLMQIIQNNKFSQSAIKHYVMHYCKFSFLVIFFSFQWVDINVKSSFVYIYITNAFCWIVKSNTLLPLLNMTFHKLHVYLTCMIFFILYHHVRVGSNWTIYVISGEI